MQSVEPNRAPIEYSLHYSRCHQFSDEYYEIMLRLYQQMFRDILPADKSARILDVGCGSGFAVESLLKMGYSNVCGIDAAESLVQIARGRKLPVDFVPPEETEAYLASVSGSFDVVLLFEVLEHLKPERQIGFLRSIQQSLTPGGIFLCQVPNALCVTAPYIRYADWTHCCLFSIESLSFVLENSGFAVEEIRSETGRPSPARRGPLSVLMPLARTALQGITNLFWRVVVVANLGVPLGFTHPISPTILAIAKTPSKR
jgi:2-polyprenyl-3-methyl-5-hydroxy-6-metoxy-1,4-benzoquinol methylase